MSTRGARSRTEAYWRRALADVPSPVPLAIDRTPGSASGPDASYAAETSEIQPRDAETIRAFAERQRLPVECVLHAAWALLLSRYAADSQVVFGLGPESDAAGALGTNGGDRLPGILPIRAEISADALAGPWTLQLHALTGQALEYADCSDADLQCWRGAPEAAALFESVVFHGPPPDTGERWLPDLAPLEERLRGLPVPCGLALVAFGCRHLAVLHDGERFDASAIRRMLGHFQVLLLGIARHPDEPASALELLTDAERQQLLFDWNDTARSFPDATLQELFRARVEEAPDRTAVVFENRQLSYGELDARANQLARHLQGLGVGPGSLVGICVERSLEMVVALLGVVKAGGAYLPLDPDYPAERLEFMISDAAIAVLLTAGRFVERLAGVEAPILCLDTEWNRIAAESPNAPECRATPEDLAYVIYTSGSTGRPKGALNGQRAIANQLLWMQEEYGLTAGDTVLQKTPFCFDVSLWELFLPLITGARLVLARPGGHKQGDYLVDLIEQQGVTILNFVPSMLRLFLEQPVPDRSGTLRHVICAGEALPYELQERFFEKLDANLHNLYGPTEAAIHVSFWACERDSRRHSVPIGRPVANTQTLILDPRMKLVPVGIPGELHIGGVQLARGYLNRPELTAERFVANPYSQEPGSRLYKTGDLVRQLPDGSIEYLGRLDHQIKIRGFRIELGEIESVLLEHPDVRDAVVVVRGQACAAHLAAYVVPERPTPRLEAALRGLLEKKLPDYMLPSAFVLLDALPLTPNDKVDRLALPAPRGQRPSLEVAFIPPRTQLEKHLAALWCDLLEIDRVGIADRFFELGGDSLRAARFINELQRELAASIYVVSLFEAPTVSEYAAFLRQHYPEAVSRRFGGEAAAERLAGNDRGARIDEGSVAKMRDVIPGLTPAPEDEPHPIRNPPALFILAPPRSGTTLLRIILAGHPDLMACSELQLLGFHTLAERKAAFSGKFSLWLDGTKRALMDLEGCDAAEATRIMERFERQGTTTQAFYALMQEWSGGRMLVDKSPFYALDLATLRKAERDFESPLYIHLTRHPYAMVRSFEDHHMDQVLRLREHSFSRRQLAELVWTVSHQNILEFLKQVPGHRQFRMRFEDLVSEPAPVLEGMCEALGFSFHPHLLDPYKDQEKKMIDGVHDVSTPMDDRKFREHRRINPEVGEAWKAVETDDFLGGVTWEVAEVLGYPLPGAPSPAWEPAATDPESARRELRRARRQRRLKHRVREPKGPA